MSIPLRLGEHLSCGVGVAGPGQCFGVVDAEVIGSAVRVVGEVGDRTPEALDCGTQIALSQRYSAADGGGERLGAAGRIRAVPRGAVGDAAAWERQPPRMSACV